MRYEELPRVDQQEIRDELVQSLGRYALDQKDGTNPLAQSPVEYAEADAALAFERGWAVKDGDRWTIKLDDYLAWRGNREV